MTDLKKENEMASPSSQPHHEVLTVGEPSWMDYEFSDNDDN
jgi:hypothetical protein